MVEPDFELSANAVGAIAVCFVIDSGALSLAGATRQVGIHNNIKNLDEFSELVAPGDRDRLATIKTGKPCDFRLRISGQDNIVRYVRLMGKSDEPGLWHGFLIPAGSDVEGGIEKLDLETALRSALSNGEIYAYHQPIVDLKTDRLVGFEALARWDRPDGDLLNPDEFLPLAVEHGLTEKLGTTVRESAIRDASAWHAASASKADLFIAANATAGEICMPDFSHNLLSTLETMGLKPGRFKLEVNESEVISDPDAAEKTMKTLKSKGVSLALDDFGTGYSSLSRLDRFPFDTVKIDQYFIRAALSDPSARAIVSSVVSIARSYSMTIVCEGVETKESAKMCQDLGCDYGQGFRFSRALKPQDAAIAVAQGIAGRFTPPLSSTTGRD